MQRQDESPTAAVRTLSIVELLEEVLKNLSPRDLLHAASSCHKFRNVIRDSPVLQKCLYLSGVDKPVTKIRLVGHPLCSSWPTDGYHAFCTQEVRAVLDRAKQEGYTGDVQLDRSKDTVTVYVTVAPWAGKYSHDFHEMVRNSKRIRFKPLVFNPLAFSPSNVHIDSLGFSRLRSSSSSPNAKNPPCFPFLDGWKRALSSSSFEEPLFRNMLLTQPPVTQISFLIDDYYGCRPPMQLGEFSEDEQAILRADAARGKHLIYNGYIIPAVCGRPNEYAYVNEKGQEWVYRNNQLETRAPGAGQPWWIVFRNNLLEKRVSGDRRSWWAVFRNPNGVTLGDLHEVLMRRTQVDMDSELWSDQSVGNHHDFTLKMQLEPSSFSDWDRDTDCVQSDVYTHKTSVYDTFLHCLQRWGSPQNFLRIKEIVL